jgi:ankyrin repeat protein
MRMIAAAEGHVEMVRLLIHAGAHVNARAHANSNATAPHSACVWGQRRVVSVLVQIGHANYHLRDSDGMTPRECAVVNGNLAIARMLFALETASKVTTKRSLNRRK